MSVRIPRRIGGRRSGMRAPKNPAVWPGLRCARRPTVSGRARREVGGGKCRDAPPRAGGPALPGVPLAPARGGTHAGMPRRPWEVNGCGRREPAVATGKRRCRYPANARSATPEACARRPARRFVFSPTSCDWADPCCRPFLLLMFEPTARKRIGICRDCLKTAEPPLVPMLFDQALACVVDALHGRRAQLSLLDLGHL